MIAVTIGVGPRFAPLAEMAAASCAARTGLPVSILGEEAMAKHGAKTPSGLKFKLFDAFPDAATILYFDADLIFLQSWDARQWAGADEFICVRDLSDMDWIISDARSIGIPPRDYFNSGLFIVNRTRHAAMLRLAGELYGRIHTHFTDQTHLNAARAWLNLPARYLPKTHNWLVLEKDGSPDLKDAVAAHLLSLDQKPHATQLRYHQYWKPEPVTASPALSQVESRLLAGPFVYERVGHDSRRMRFASKGELAEGSAGCETRWRLSEEDGRPVLWLGNGRLPICALEEDEHGIWQGRWMHWEQMPVRLTPIKRPTGPAAKTVEVVITNWRRPANVRQIMEAFCAQTAPCRITLIDAADAPQALDAKTLQLADRHFRFSHNFGGVNRYIPALGYHADYTYFHDDDMLPGPRVIEHFLEHAARTPEFSVLGQFGRILTAEGRYIIGDTPRYPDKCKPVDFLVRGYFIKTHDLQHIWPFAKALNLEIQDCEDDLLLCCALAVGTGKPCLVTPLCDVASSMAARYLPEPSALSRRHDHLTRRECFLKAAQRAGWKNLLHG